jgi:hypothetical protein
MYTCSLRRPSPSRRQRRRYLPPPSHTRCLVRKRRKKGHRRRNQSSRATLRPQHIPRPLSKHTNLPWLKSSSRSTLTLATYLSHPQCHPQLYQWYNPLPLSRLFRHRRLWYQPRPLYQQGTFFENFRLWPFLLINYSPGYVYLPE